MLNIYADKQFRKKHLFAYFTSSCAFNTNKHLRGYASDDPPKDKPHQPMFPIPKTANESKP